MKFVRLFVLLVLALGPCGCPNPDDSAGPPETSQAAGAEFIEGKGLLIPPATRDALAIQLVDVIEGDVDADLVLRGQIFKVLEDPAGNRTAEGGVSLSPEQAARIGSAGTVLIEKTKKGQVVERNESALGATGKIEVIFRTADPDMHFNSGQSVEVSFELHGGPVTLVPETALLETINGAFVYVPNGKYLFRTAVRTGMRTNQSVEILDGLYSGDQVVSSAVRPLWLTELNAIKGGVGCAHGH